LYLIIHDGYHAIDEFQSMAVDAGDRVKSSQVNRCLSQRGDVL
jgi:hypothetical protein